MFSCVKITAGLVVDAGFQKNVRSKFLELTTTFLKEADERYAE